MKRVFPLAAVAAAALGVAFTVGGRGDGEELGDNQRLCPPSVERIAKVSGAWLYTIDFGNGPFEGEMQFFADGNVVANNTVIQEGTTHLTTAMGAWERTGLRTIAITALIRIVNPDGELLSYEKIVGEVTIEGDTLTGVGAGLIYLPGMDPLDPSVNPVFVYGPAEFTGKRIVVAALPE